MAKRRTAVSSNAAGKRLALCAVALMGLMAPLAARAEEPSGSVSDKLSVNAVVSASCHVAAGSTTVDEGAAMDLEAAASAVPVRCAPGVRPRTSLAYEVVAGGGETKQLVLAVEF